MKGFLLLILSLTLSIHAKVAVPSRVAPGMVDEKTKRITGQHLYWEAQGRPKGLLLISIGGTNSLPTALMSFDELAVAKGFFAIAVDYPNSVISTICRDEKYAKDHQCFDRFRAGVCEGVPPGMETTIQPKDSLEYRIESLMRYLSRPAAGAQGHKWKEFMMADHLDWSKVVLVGHSQGSGHAAYLAKQHEVHGAILLAGPQDSTDDYVAPWVLTRGKTPTNRYLSFVHAADYFGSDSQIKVVRKLLENDGETVFDFDHDGCPKGDWHILRTARVLAGFEKDPHNSVTQPGFSDVYECILTRE